MPDIPLLQRGSAADRQKNRQQLTAYGWKIYTREITYEELRQDLLLGGDPNVLSDYAPDVTWLADRDEMLLNFFIGDGALFLARAQDTGNDPRYPEEWASLMAEIPSWKKDDRSDLYRSLALLL
ncbi:MAG: hypothetical protein ACK5HY_12990 [Parahaliea sp.]